MHRILFVLFVFVISGSVLADTLDCPAFVQKTIEATRTVCGTLDSNQVCYGNALIEIQPRDNVRLNFSKAGDTAPLASLQSLTSTAFDVQKSNWGVALMNMRLNLVEGGVTAVAFGNALVENKSEAPNDFLTLEIVVSEPTGANLRAEPKPDVTVVRQVYSGDRLAAIGRIDDSTWFRIADGWISKDVIRSTADLSLLPVLPPDSQNASVYAPMQSIQLHTGLDDAPCGGVPSSGLLLQTPAGVSVNLQVNGAVLNVNGTVLFQTTADSKTVVSVLEGELLYREGYSLKPAEQMQYGFQGDQIQYSSPAEYNFANAHYLPVVLLPREFEIPFALGGVIFSFTPGTGFLQGFSADAACVAAWTVDVNLRGGPGTNYPIRRGVTGGFYGKPDARAIGADGEVWWRLGEGVWIAANSTATAGACGSLPLVAPPPLPSS